MGDRMSSQAGRRGARSLKAGVPHDQRPRLTLGGVLASPCRLGGALGCVSTKWQQRGVRLRTIQSSGLRALPAPGTAPVGSDAKHQSSPACVERLATVLPNPRVSSSCRFIPSGV